MKFKPFKAKVRVIEKVTLENGGRMDIVSSRFEKQPVPFKFWRRRMTERLGDFFAFLLDISGDIVEALFWW